MSTEDSRKVALVTGGSRGIGRGIVMELAAEGYDIGFSYNSASDEALEVKQAVEALGRRCHMVQSRLEESGAASALCREVVEVLGGIDVLVCNAGLTRFGSLLTITEEDADFLYRLNFRAYLMCARAAANDMIARDVKGRILFIASTRGIRAYPEDMLYGSLKAGLIRAVQSMALELAPRGITVNCIAPGATKVRGNLDPESLAEGYIASLVPLGRNGSPAEVGQLAAYLVSEKAAYITGETIRIDGGLILPGKPERPKQG